MELTPSQKKTVRHQFDSFCRKVLREEARDYIRELMRRAAHEVPLSGLSEEQMERLCVLDEYLSEAIHFDVQGYDVAIIESSNKQGIWRVESCNTLEPVLYRSREEYEQIGLKSKRSDTL